jgi:hypothetical protein
MDERGQHITQQAGQARKLGQQTLRTPKGACTARAHFCFFTRGSFMSGDTSSTRPPRCSSPIFTSAAGSRDWHVNARASKPGLGGRSAGPTMHRCGGHTSPGTREPGAACRRGGPRGAAAVNAAPHQRRPARLPPPALCLSG